MTGYLAPLVWRREIKRGGQDPFQEFLKLIRMEMITEDL